MTVAALYVATGGAYYGIPDVDPWDEVRDARKYDGPHPVVAHPPCSVWCQLAAVNEKRWGRMRGDDGGCFAAALASVRRWGGVLEHPAFSLAWERHGLPAPTSRGWQRTMDGAWVGEVLQFAYGHRARKATWLYAVTAAPPPRLLSTDRVAEAQCGHQDVYPNKTVLRPAEAKATPEQFRDLLLGIARRAVT